jgi:signal transduction histidine kinase
MDDDRLLSGAIAGTHRTMVFAGLAAVSLLVGLVLTVRASRASAQLAAMRSEFVSTVTHELKTPIAGIRLLGETLVRSKIAESGPFREYPRSVVRESKRLMRLVENLLAYARVTDLAAVYQFEAINLRPIVEGVVRTFRVQLGDGGFDVRVEIAADVPRLRGDRTALTLALDNLLDNAIRYSGSARVIRLRAGRHTPGKVWLEVVDQGIGISAEDLQYVTRRFFRGSNAGSGGSGLGLAIVDRIVADHGGTLTFVSEPGAGTTVRLVMPAGA